MRIIQEDEEVKYFREQRQRECFSIINRGKLWYDRLSNEQISELKMWYQAWLDVTETKVIPTRPKWLNDKLYEEEFIW